MDLSNARCPKCRAIGRINRDGWCRNCGKRVHSKELDLVSIGDFNFPPQSITIEKIRLIEKRLLARQICEACGAGGRELVLHHWFNNIGKRFERAVCLPCNGRLSDHNFPGVHLLPGWKAQKAYIERGGGYSYYIWIKVDVEWLRLNGFTNRDLFGSYKKDPRYINTIKEVIENVPLPPTERELDVLEENYELLPHYLKSPW